MGGWRNRKTTAEITRESRLSRELLPDVDHDVVNEGDFPRVLPSVVNNQGRREENNRP
jgi:hypothetical protein